MKHLTINQSFYSICEAGIISNELIFPIISVLFLLVFSGLVSGSEVAFFSMTPTDKDKLKNDISKHGINAKKLLEKPQELLATILIANNFINVAIIILASSILTFLYPINDWIKFSLEIILITFVILLVGEVIPKIYATKNSLFLVKIMSTPLFILNKLPPFSWLKRILVYGTSFVGKYSKKRGVKISSDELEQAIALTKEESTSDDEQKILEGIVKFGNTDVKQIMCSRIEVVALEDNMNFREIMSIILDAGYSRIPVYQKSFDNVTGILYVKDLLPHINEKEDFNWLSLLRKPFFVPENKKIDDLLKEFQIKKMHLAVVVDEYGGSSGIVTLEDVLEEIVGDITDEFDDEEVEFTKLDDHTFLFEGRTALIDFYKILKIDGKEFENEKGEADTIAGFIIEKAGRILKNKEFIKFENYKLIVESSDKRRIKSVKIVVESKSI
jgi:putative hemolysin